MFIAYIKIQQMVNPNGCEVQNAALVVVDTFINLMGNWQQIVDRERQFIEPIKIGNVFATDLLVLKIPI